MNNRSWYQERQKELILLSRQGRLPNKLVWSDPLCSDPPDLPPAQPVGLTPPLAAPAVADVSSEAPQLHSISSRLLALPEDMLFAVLLRTGMPATVRALCGRAKRAHDTTLATIRVRKCEPGLRTTLPSLYPLLTACTSLTSLHLEGSEHRMPVNLSLLAPAVPALQELRLIRCFGITDLSPLAACLALQRLTLDDCMGSGLPALAPLLALTALEELSLLSLTSPLFTVTSLAPLTALLSLRTLNLANLPNVRQSLPGLAPGLRQAAWGAPGLLSHALPMLPAGTRLQQLQHLDLSANSGVTSLLPLSACTNLIRLNVAWSHSVPDHHAFLTPLTGLTGLQHLKLRWDERSVSPAPLASLPRLQRLEVSWDRDLFQPPFEALTSLVHLQLAWGMHGIDSYAAMAALTRLTHLELAWGESGPDDKDIALLSAMKPWSQQPQLW